MKFWLIAAAAMLAGCSKTPGVGAGAIIGPLPAAGIVHVSPENRSLPIVADIPDGAVVVGTVDGTSCRNSAFDPPPSEAKANEQLRQKAASMGANGIAAVTYQKGGTSFVTNCWSTIKATGTAYLL